ncbi:MAG: YggT family protein [Caldilineae bacterium]|nr:MAG: YggT family protein [Caldilineae bacterium]
MALNFVATFINLLANILVLALIARAILSWVRIDPYHPIIRLLDQITEPVLAPIRRLLPMAAGLDFSPIIAIVLIDIVRRFLLALLL